MFSTQNEIYPNVVPLKRDRPAVQIYEISLDFVTPFSPRCSLPPPPPCCHDNHLRGFRQFYADWIVLLQNTIGNTFSILFFKKKLILEILLYKRHIKKTLHNRPTFILKQAQTFITSEKSAWYYNLNPPFNINFMTHAFLRRVIKLGSYPKKRHSSTKGDFY